MRRCKVSNQPITWLFNDAYWRWEAVHWIDYNKGLSKVTSPLLERSPSCIASGDTELKTKIYVFIGRYIRALTMVKFNLWLRESKNSRCSSKFNVNLWSSQHTRNGQNIRIVTMHELGFLVPVFDWCIQIDELSVCESRRLLVVGSIPNVCIRNYRLLSIGCYNWVWWDAHDKVLLRVH